MLYNRIFYFIKLLFNYYLISRTNIIIVSSYNYYSSLYKESIHSHLCISLLFNSLICCVYICIYPICYTYSLFEKNSSH